MSWCSPKVAGVREVHPAVVDADGLVGGRVVVLDHALAAHHDDLADLARREPGDLHVGGGPALEGERQERRLGHAVLEDAAADVETCTTGRSSQ